jgi:serine/threonine protein kinase
MTPEEGEILALLVHRGFVSADRVRSLLGERQDGEELASLLARGGVCSLADARRLVKNRVGESPQLTRYEIESKLGSGGTAHVFAAQDREDRKRVALKILREELLHKAVAVQRFVAEAKQLCALEHPGLVQGHRVAKDQGTIFLAMELIQGENLEDLLLRDERLDEDEALGVALQVAETLQYLREQGLVHRDIKPGNLMRLPNGRVQIIDLGFAAQAGAADGGATTVGTVQYIAPEQARGESDLDARADIYSLGATIYHLVTGETPFQGEGRDVLLQQVGSELSSSRLRELGLSPTLHYFIEKMMAKDREIRFQDAGELVLELREKVGPSGPEAPATSPSLAKRRRRTTSSRRARRRR